MTPLLLLNLQVQRIQLGLEMLSMGLGCPVRPRMLGGFALLLPGGEAAHGDE